MAQPTSNTLPITNPFALAPKKPANPLINAPAPTIPANTGFGTNGAPMSVLPAKPAVNISSGQWSTPVNTPLLSDQIRNSGFVNSNTTPSQPLVSQPIQNTGTPSVTTSGYNPTNTAGGIGSVDKPQPTPSPYSSFPGLLSLGVGTAQGAIPIGQKAADIAGKYGEQIASVGKAGAAATNSIGKTTPVVFGNNAIIAQNTAAEQTALAQGEAAALQGTSQELTAQNNAAGQTLQGANLAQPVTQAGLLTNPQTGQPLNPSIVASAVQQATQLVQNGADVNSPQVQALLQPFGFYGADAFTRAQQALSGGNYNPSAQSAIVQQNLSQGQQYQAQAQGISNSLQLLQSIRPQLTNFMSQAGLNPATEPILNTQINKIDAQGNAAAYKTMNAVVGEAKSFVQQMLQAQGGMTPTDAGQITDSYDFGSLTPKELNQFLQNMEVVGNYRLSQAQSASQTGYNAGGNAAQGVNANTNEALKSEATSALNAIPAPIRIGLGSLSSVLSGIGNAVGAGGSSVIGGAAGAATEGLAAKVLAL